MRIAACFAVLSCLLLCGCNLVQETQESHIVHRGEKVLLFHGADQTVPVAVQHSDIHALAAALDSNDQVRVKDLVAKGKVVELARGTHVHITGESYNERKIEIDEGPHFHETAWVPFEWLRPEAPVRR